MCKIPFSLFEISRDCFFHLELQLELAPVRAPVQLELAPVQTGAQLELAPVGAPVEKTSLGKFQKVKMKVCPSSWTVMTNRFMWSPRKCFFEEALTYFFSKKVRNI